MSFITFTTDVTTLTEKELEDLALEVRQVQMSVIVEQSARESLKQAVMLKLASDPSLSYTAALALVKEELANPPAQQNGAFPVTP